MRLTRSLDRTRAGHVSFQLERRWPPAPVSSGVRHLMSFRRVQNAQDKWESYCQTQAAMVEATGLPDEVFRREDLLQEFLRCGAFQAGAERLSLSEMSDVSFLALEKFIEPVFDFQHAYPALTDERFRRFKRYA